METSRFQQPSTASPEMVKAGQKREIENPSGAVT